MLVAIPKEIFENENRVAVIPPMIGLLTKSGLDIVVEKGAGAGAFIRDETYSQAGATIQDNTEALFAEADIILKIHPLLPNKTIGKHEIELIKEGAAVISILDAYFHLDLVQKLASKKITSFGMEFVPRITRAQSMDVLSSMASIAGYSAVLDAAAYLPKYFPMLMTSAGTISPAKVFVIGAGVAGLMAIATSKRLGSVVEAYDTRPVVKEQVESVGAKFVEFDLEVGEAQDKGGYAKAQSDEFYKKQQEQMAIKVASVDVVITTAAIPGKRSPVLITENMLEQMSPGSVIVDLAAERGGNVEGSEKGKIVVKHGVTIIGTTDYPSRTAVHASQLYSKNIITFLLNMIEEGNLNITMEDEIIEGSLITHKGEVVNQTLKALLEESSNSK